MNDPSIEIASNVATQLIKDSISALYTPISSIVTVKRAQFLEGFSSYCTLVYGKSSLVRTLYSKNKPVPLNEVYVKTRFHQGHDRFADNDLINRFAAGDRVIVKGNGGSGKTIFLKHLWLTRFETPGGRIPIFVELRRLNDLQSIDIISFCRNELQSDMVFGKGVFEKLCQAGKFEFIFDGFDEVNRENRKTVERQILSMSELYRDCCFLVSGREDDRFSSWGSFEIFSVAPLALDDAKELINKIPFDRKVKKKFLQTLNDEFYRQHSSFLSSPLLAVMMLMTFNENAIIPSKLTEFYKSAFQTLLTWHDATKDSFERERSLSVDEFRRVFSTFCLITYYDQVFEFDEDQFRKYIGKSIDYHSIDASLDSVKDDICESANLLQKDGLKFIFIHRSFQEYFAAECAMQVVSGKANEFLNVFSGRPRDSVFAMCYEIHPELVYDQYLAREIHWMTSRETPLSNRSEAADRIWGIDEFSIEFVVNDLIGFHADGIWVETTPDYDRVSKNLELCSQVSGFNLGTKPVHRLLDLMLQSFRKVEYEEILNPIGSEKLKIEVKLYSPKLKISIRNAGTAKFPQDQMRPFRSRFISAFSSELNQVQRDIEDYYKKTDEMLSQLKAERLAKEKSIDDILGI